MRLIDMRRTRRLADSYYRIIRAKGYSDELNVSEDELRRMLGVTNLRYDNSGYAELNFSTENHIPYTKLDGTLEADIAAIKDSVDDPVEVSTNVGRFAEEQRLTDAYRAAHPEEFDEEE